MKPPLAVIPTGVAVSAGVGNVQLAPAMATAQKAGEQSLAPAQRTAAHRVLAVGIVCDQAEVPLVVRPAQITLMVIRDQHLPVLALLLEAAHHLLAAGLDADAAAGASEGIGAGVDRVGQDMQDRVVDWQLPFDHAAFGAISGRGQWDAFVPEPEVHLTHRMHLGELGEDESDRLRNAPIRILLDTVVADAHIADGDRHEQLAAARFTLQRLERALAQHRQLHLAHGALHAEQQAIVGMARIVDAVLVDDERADEAAELQERVPVAAVACES